MDLILFDISTLTHLLQYQGLRNFSHPISSLPEAWPEPRTVDSQYSRKYTDTAYLSWGCMVPNKLNISFVGQHTLARVSQAGPFSRQQPQRDLKPCLPQALKKSEQNFAGGAFVIFDEVTKVYGDHFQPSGPRLSFAHSPRRDGNMAWRPTFFRALGFGLLGLSG